MKEVIDICDVLCSMHRANFYIDMAAASASLFLIFLKSQGADDSTVNGGGSGPLRTAYSHLDRIERCKRELVMMMHKRHTTRRTSEVSKRETKEVDPTEETDKTVGGETVSKNKIDVDATNRFIRSTLNIESASGTKRKGGQAENEGPNVDSMDNTQKDGRTSSSRQKASSFLSMFSKRRKKTDASK